MDNNESVKILESYIEVENYNNSINEKMYLFINKCQELENLSKYQYGLQKTLELNKNYFQGYVLDSYLCKYIETNTGENYSINQLKEWVKQYSSNSDDEYNSYYLALELYEMADDIERLIEQKIEFQMNLIYEFDNNIQKIEDTKDYENLYNKIKDDLENKLLNKNLIDDGTFNKLVVMLNDIFNFCVSGYPDIPDEYLEREGN